MKSRLIRRIAPAAIVVGIGLGAAGASASAWSPGSESPSVAPATANGCTSTSTGNPAPYNSSEPSFFFFSSTFSCSGPKGVAQRVDFGIFGSFVTLNNQPVQTTDFSDAFVRWLAGLPG